MKGLAQEAGVCRATIYRRFQKAPWREGRGSFEGRLFNRLSVILREGEGITSAELDRGRNVLLWMAGYNPFAERSLSSEDMEDLYQTVETRLAQLLEKRGSDGK